MDDIEVFKHVFPNKYFYEFWLKDKRPDGRNFTEIRKSSINRSKSSGFILNSGNNVIQTNYSIQSTKVKINTDSNSVSDQLYEKVAIQFDQEASFPLFFTCVHHLKNIIVQKYERYLSMLKINEKIVIEMSALFHDASVLTSLMMSVLISLYDCFVNKFKISADSIDLLFPLIIKAFYIPEKDALLWLWDPNTEEFSLNTQINKTGLYFTIHDLNTNNLSFEKIEGTDMSLDDLANLTELSKFNIDRPGLKHNLLNYLANSELRTYNLT